jgi:uncharacterized SAM-binding protein YcdF (DUF218 family)
MNHSVVHSWKGKLIGTSGWSRVPILILGFVAIWLGSWIAARILIVRFPIEHPEVIVVLSGSSTLRERVEHAAKLFRAQQPQRIILTNDNQHGGWSSAEQRNPFFYEYAKRKLLQLGVPADRIEVLYTPATGTWNEALIVREYVTTKNIHSVLIVTSSYHSRRALASFRSVFPQTVVIGMDPVETGIQTPSPAVWCFHWRGWQIVLPEYVKLIYYLPSFARNA